MPATTRQRPQPAGEPAPVTVDPSPTPVEDVPEHATPAPRPPDDEVPPGYFRRVDGQIVPIGSLLVAGRDRTPAGDLRDDHPLSAPEALAEVLRRVPAIAKGRTAAREVGGYAFRGIDDVYAALHDLFGEVGLVVLPSTVERLTEQRPKASGTGVNYVTHLHVRFRFLASDGTSEECDAWGEGSDTGDKGTGKAHSQAAKSALLAAFLIPTEASSNDDPDATGPEPSRPFTPGEQERAGKALDAAREAATLDALVGVGRRANAGGLLDVPIVDEKGGIAPLRLYLDALRLRLESQVQS